MNADRKDFKVSGIYSIICAINGKQYIGCSSNIYKRIIAHKCHLNKNDKRHENQHFIDDWNKYGSESFYYTILEYTNEDLKDKEYYYINKFNTIDREKGYNLRRDSSKTGMIALEETHKKYSEAMKRRFSKQSERDKISIFFKDFWKNNQEKKDQMIKKVSLINTKHTFKQFTKDGIFVKEWKCVNDILKENPTYKRHNIYAVCSGEKPSIYGYVWTKSLN